MRVLARAYRDRPLDRVLVEARDGVAYIANPSVDNSVRNTIGTGIGFPAQFVFEFDDELFARLSAAWDHADAALLSRLWGEARALAACVLEDA